MGDELKTCKWERGERGRGVREVSQRAGEECVGGYAWEEESRRANYVGVQRTVSERRVVRAKWREFQGGWVVGNIFWCFNSTVCKKNP